MSISDTVKPICKLKDVIDRETLGDLFVAYSKDKPNKALVYLNDGFNNSDRVRSAFSKQKGVKFVDVRCRKLKNVK